jgi:effector-binding domain-containing protein
MSMNYTVTVEQVEPHPTAIVRRRARPEELSTVVPQACGEVWQYAREDGLPGPGRNLALYLDGETNLECGVEVAGIFAGNGRVIPSSTPAGIAATTMHLGPYDRLGAAHEAIGAWCKERGLEFAGPSWEIYGHWTDDVAQLRSDVFYLLRA